jgi:putative phosphotransacetylase
MKLDTEKLIRDVVANVISRLDSQIPQQEKAVSGQNSTKLAPSVTSASAKKVVCSISVRHVHVCREHLDILYGKDYEPTILKELYQPKNYAYKETLTVVGPKLNAIQNVRILGPLRDKTQVELAKTDCVILGVDAPVRPSGKLEGTSSVVLIGPKGAVYLKEGVIRANRHIHLCDEDAAYYGIKDGQEVDVRVSGPKGLTFNNVQVRVSPEFKSEMHIDTDDGNAADMQTGTLVEIVNASCVAPIMPAIVDPKQMPPSIEDESISGEITDPNMLASIKNAASPATTEAKAESLTKKEVITVADLDRYASTGIVLSPSVILSPLARDEAVSRGIKIT